MIKVDLSYHLEQLIHVEIFGHAQSNEYGKDLVCAGVSSIATGIANTLVKHDFLSQGKIVLREGYIDITVDNVTSENQLILETLVISLKGIEDSYGQYIKINQKEE
ncbi:ribosomal-processing cysteine protease Prp [Eggerthia catenaformis]